MLLRKGATASRIFWVVNGAVAFATSSTMIGTIINNAEISFGDGSILNGRELTVAGAVSIYGQKVTAPFQCYVSSEISLPVKFGAFSAITKNRVVRLSFQVLSQSNNK